jgi:hypothetical protein
MKIDLDDLERRAQTANANWLLESIAAPLPQETLALVMIARAAQALRIARRDGLCGDYEQDMREALAQALDAAGLGIRPSGNVADGSPTPNPNPQPQDRYLILEVIHDLDRRVLQAQADGYPQSRDIERKQSAALRRWLERTDAFLGGPMQDARGRWPK